LWKDLQLHNNEKNTSCQLLDTEQPRHTTTTKKTCTINSSINDTIKQQQEAQTQTERRKTRPPD
jgi:hypothetical protein